MKILAKVFLFITVGSLLVWLVLSYINGREREDSTHDHNRDVG
jgi:hypothetical protein